MIYLNLGVTYDNLKLNLDKCDILKFINDIYEIHPHIYMHTLLSQSF